MLKLNPGAAVDAVADINQVFDAKRDDTLSLLRKNKARLSSAAERLRGDHRSKAAHRVYLAAAAHCGISPKTLDTFFGLPYTVSDYRAHFSLSARAGSKYAVSGPLGLQLLSDVFEQPVRARLGQAPSTTPERAPAPRSSGLVIRIDGYPNLSITTRTSNLSTLIDVLKDL